MIDIATSIAAPPMAKGALTAAASSKAGTFEIALSALTPAPFAPDVLYDEQYPKAAPVAPAAPPPIDTTPYADCVLIDLSGKRQRIAGGGKDAPPKSAPIPEPDEDATKDTIRSPIVTDVPVPVDTTPYADLVLLDLSGKRQRKAGTGEDVSVEAKPADADATKDVNWSPVMIAPPLPAPVTPIALPVSGGAAVPAFADSGPAIYTTPEQGGIPSGETIAKSLPSIDWVPAPTGEVSRAVANGLTVPVLPTRDTMKIDLPLRIDVAPGPVPQQSAPAPITQLAGQAFAAAIAVAVQSHRDEREPTDARAPLAVAATALEVVHKPAVTATADAKQGALDLRQDSGLQGMIDRIETLRDDANARDTRIRLVPDALGAVDVSVRKDGERVHVHFAAENQASARLLSEAQPRLADLAEARGVKLGQTTVGSGTDSNASNARQQQSTPVLPTAPAAILAAAAADITDTRIA